MSGAERRAMETRTFSYHWSIKAMKWFFIFGGIAFIVSSIFLVVSGYQLADAFGEKPEIAFFLVLLFLLVTPILYICLLSVDRFPEIGIDNDKVTIKYLFKKICIYWDDIINVENRKTPWFSKRKDKFVLTRKLPFYCRASNIVFHGVFNSGFIINSSMIDFDILSADIKKRIHIN